MLGGFLPPHSPLGERAGIVGNNPDSLGVIYIDRYTSAQPHPGGTVSLSEQEQRALREIEQSLLADDPKFGASVSGDAQLSGIGSGNISMRGLAIAVVGLLLLIGGVALSAQSLWFIGLSIVGFLVMFGAGVWMLRGGGSGPRPTKSRRSPRPKPGGGSPKDGGSMEENFRRRFEGR